MRIVLVAVFVLCAASVEAAIPLNIPFTSNTNYNCNGVDAGALLARTRKGSAAPGNVWDGNISGSFLVFDWWDWDVSGLPAPGTTSVPAGYTEVAGACASSWADTTWYLPFKINVVSPILAYPNSEPPDGNPDGDTQMKWFIWGVNPSGGSVDGTQRVILMLFAGNADANSGPCGGVEATQTCIALCGGVSANCAQTLFPNGQTVYVQVSWRWGQEGTAFQRIYINQTNEGSPTASNVVFDDTSCTGHPVGDGWWCFPGDDSLSDQFFIGNIDNTGSAVRDNAQILSSEYSLSTTWTPNWGPGGTSNDGPARLRIRGDILYASVPLALVPLLRRRRAA